MSDNEEWHKVHAQLLKNVADAQGRLLAAQNETCDGLRDLKDQLEGTQRDIVLRLEAAMRWLNGRLDAIGALLAELLQPKSSATLRKSYRTQPKSKRKRHG